MISKPVIALAGAAVGAIGTYIYYKFVKEPETERNIQELRAYARECKKYGNEMREYAEEMYYDLKGADVNADFEQSYEEYAEEKRKKKEAEVIASEKGIVKNDISKNRQKIDYTKYYDKYFDDHDPAESEHPTDDSEEDSNKIKPAVNPDSDIFCITEAEYNDPNSKYSKQELEYYDECGSICKIDYDAANESVLVDNPLYLIGTKWSNNFDEEDYSYIRNNRLKTDYRITRYQGSYNEIVLGVYDD